MTKVFITDYDGVVINIEPQKAKAFGQLLQKHWGVDPEKASDFWLETSGASRRCKFDYFYNQRFGKKIAGNDYGIIEQKYSRLLKEEFYPKVKIMPGAEKLLRFAREKFNFVFVTSGVPMAEIKYLVKLNGMDTYFDEVLGVNREFPSKKEHFERIIRNYSPQLIVFVADGPVDFEIAQKFNKKSRIRMIGLSINHPREKLINAGADIVVNNAVAVVPIIKNILGA